MEIRLAFSSISYHTSHPELPSTGKLGESWRAHDVACVEPQIQLNKSRQIAQLVASIITVIKSFQKFHLTTFAVIVR